MLETPSVIHLPASGDGAAAADLKADRYGAPELEAYNAYLDRLRQRDDQAPTARQRSSNNEESPT